MAQWGKPSHSTCTARDTGDIGSVTGSGRSPGGGRWQHTPVSLPEKSCGQRNLVGYSPWGHKESDVTEQLSTHTAQQEIVTPLNCMSLKIKTILSHKISPHQSNKVLIFSQTDVSMFYEISWFPGFLQNNFCFDPFFFGWCLKNALSLSGNSMWPKNISWPPKYSNKIWAQLDCLPNPKLNKPNRPSLFPLM